MLRKYIFTALAVLGLLSAPSFAAENDGVTVGNDGLFKEDFLIDSFLEFGDDLSDAAAEGKHLMVLIEQEGCPYCRELHRVNFKRPEIVELLNEHFVVVQLDLYGSRGTIDFDGEEMEERALVGKWGAAFTPTTFIFTADKDGSTSFRDALSFGMPGYLKPFHYITSLEYVVSGAYKETDFQRFLKEKVIQMQEKGLDIDMW